MKTDIVCNLPQIPAFHIADISQKKYFKKNTLQEADVQLELLRLYNDLSYDMQFIDEKRYKLVSEKLCEIGRLLGGWIKSQKETSTTAGK